jgi:hypothetical protein
VQAGGRGDAARGDAASGVVDLTADDSQVRPAAPPGSILEVIHLSQSSAHQARTLVWSMTHQLPYGSSTTARTHPHSR